MSVSDQPYPVLMIIVRHGEKLAVSVAVVLLVAAAWTLVVGSGYWITAICLAVSAFGYFMMRSYVELVRLIADMLLPR